jgi:DNA polymerase-3 subunit gamma/tau
MGGQLPEALLRVAKLNELGADPLQIAQDLLAITHLVTKFKVAPEIVGRSVTDLESEKGNDLASRLPMVQLGRCWQMLIKGISEIQNASSALPALEMVLIRLAYLSDSALGEASAEEKKTDVKKKNNEPQFIETEKLQVLPPTIGGFSEDIDTSVIRSFEEIVNLFERKKEGLIHAKLVTNVRPVRMTTGRLEIMQTAEIDEKFVGKMGKLLSKWSGQDWIISIVQDEGQKTIQEQMISRDKDVKLAALRDPLVACVIEAFPGAQVTAVRPLLSNSSDTKSNEIDIATDNT